MATIKLTKLELQIMEALWTNGPSAVREVQERFPEASRPAYTTVQTMIYRLEAKKAVRRTRKIGNAHIFEASISRASVQSRLIDDFFGLFGGTARPVMAHLIETGKLTLDDVREAERLLREIEEKGEAVMMSAVLDHLWQSTLLALAVGLLTMAFGRARAGVRHALWFTASVKFLVPFAALAALGRLLAPALRPPAEAPAPVFIVEAAEPFSRIHAAAPAAHAAPYLSPILVVIAVWALGCAVVLLTWMIRWAKVREAMGTATPLALPAPMPVLASSSMLEPGLVGLWRPVLLVPATLFEHLARPGIDAIVAHEACHLRRRDNLTAAVHMLVEALFWFHPLVWWIGVRLIHERERACDEAVVRSGHDRMAYARSLIECCRLYLQSPLSCVAGASGSNLKKRVATIMTAPPSSPLSASTKALLLAAGVFAIATPVAAGLLTSPEGQEVAARATAVIVRGSAALRIDDAYTNGPASAVAAVSPKRVTTKATPVVDREASPAPDRGLAEADVAAPPVTPDIAAQVSPLAPAPAPAASGAKDAGRLQIAELQPGPPAHDDTSASVGRLSRQQISPIVTPALVKLSRQSGGADDLDRMVCQSQPVTGSRFQRRLCMTKSDWKEEQRRLFALERRWSLDPSGFSDAGD